MSSWPAGRAKRVLAALLRIVWMIKRQSGGDKGVRNLFRPLLDHRRFGFTVFPYLRALRGGPEKVPDS